MENAEYNPALIQILANRLYSKARIVVVKSTVIGAVLFSVTFYFAASIGHNTVDIFGLAPIKFLGVGLLIGVVFGFVSGQSKSYQLKLSAQLALCQVQIEKNTRTTG